MLHSFKKKVAKNTAPVRGVNPGGEFLDYKNRLATIKKNLQYIDRRMDDAIKYWNLQIIEQRNLSQRFSTGYPIRGDETDRIAKDFEKGSTAVYDYFFRNEDIETEPYKNMQAQVKAYINELVQVEKEYRELLYIKSEAERYQTKVDTMDRRGRNNDLKRTRNLQKMDHEKMRLTEKTNKVVAAQREVYAKAPTIYKAALCAYWTAYQKHMQVISQSMSKTTQFMEMAGKDMENLDISTMFMNPIGETSSATSEDGVMHSETGSHQSGEKRKRAFEKVPSILPMSPRFEHKTVSEMDLDSDVKMEIEGASRSIAV